MAYQRQKTIKSLFKFNYYQANEEGVIETLFFTDEKGKIICIPFNANLNYGQGIEAEIDEYTYRTGASFTLKNLKAAKVLASETDLIEKEVVVEVKSEPTLKVLFKKVAPIKFVDEKTQEIIDLTRYTDAHGNNSYQTADITKTIFGEQNLTDYVVFEFTYSDLVKDYQKTIKKNPNRNYTNLSPSSIRSGKLLSPDEYDYSILDEIYQGQRSKDERYDGEIYNLYETILKERTELVAETSQETSDIPITSSDSDKNLGYKRGAEIRRQRRMQQIQDLEDALKRINELEILLQNERRETAKLREEKERLTENYQRLRNIFDGEDDQFTAVIYPTS